MQGKSESGRRCMFIDILTLRLVIFNGNDVVMSINLYSHHLVNRENAFHVNTMHHCTCTNEFIQMQEKNKITECV